MTLRLPLFALLSFSLLACAQQEKLALDTSLSPRAMLEEGRRYMVSASRPSSPELACDYFQRASELGETEGLTLLGECYSLGTGRQKNFTQAVELFQRGVAASEVTALCALGNMQVTGRGIAKDEAAGIALCRQGAEKGEVSAQISLANFYRKGTGVLLSYKDAEFWLQKALARNSAAAEVVMGDMIAAGEGRQANLEEAVTWWRKAALRGRWNGMSRLAVYYGKLALVTVDGKRAVKPTYLVETFFWSALASGLAPPVEEVQKMIGGMRDLSGLMIAGTLPNGRELIEARAEAGPSAPPPADSEPIVIKTGPTRFRQA